MLFLVMMLINKNKNVHSFWHLFHGVKNTRFLLQDFVNSTKTTFPDHMNVLVHAFVRFANGWHFELLLN